MSGRSTAEIVAALSHLVDVSDYNIKLHVEAADRLTELDARPCPNVHTADEGTSYCTLNCTHDALCPTCPTCGGTKQVTTRTEHHGDFSESTVPCPENGGNCDGKVPFERLVAVFNRVFEFAAEERTDATWGYDEGWRACIDHLRSVR